MNRREMLTSVGAAGLGMALTGAGTAYGDQHGKDGKSYNPFAIGYDAKSDKYVLPPLPYAYDALEPHIDAQTMEIHHSRHHAGYVNNLNAALDRLAEARKSDDFSAIQALSKSVSFNGGGHTLHTLFWGNLAPAGNGGGGSPSGDLKKLIDRDFGSVEAMKKQFSAAAAGVEGSGWGICGIDQVSGRLLIVQGENQQKLTTWGLVPLLVLDVWEHAYYLKYQNRRAAYVEAFWNVVNWPEVARRAAAILG